MKTLSACRLSSKEYIAPSTDSLEQEIMKLIASTRHG